MHYEHGASNHSREAKNRIFYTRRRDDFDAKFGSRDLVCPSGEILL